VSTSPSTPLLSNLHKAAMSTQCNIAGMFAVLLHAYFRRCCCRAAHPAHRCSATATRQ
jgi:hypothetical protein